MLHGSKPRGESVRCDAVSRAGHPQGPARQRLVDATADSLTRTRLVAKGGMNDSRWREATCMCERNRSASSDDDGLANALHVLELACSTQA
jgi:hypothetical protein